MVEGLTRLQLGAKSLSLRLPKSHRLFWDTVARDGAVVARRAHNPKVVGSNPTPATKKLRKHSLWLCFWFLWLLTYELLEQLLGFLSGGRAGTSQEALGKGDHELTAPGLMEVPAEGGDYLAPEDMTALIGGEGYLLHA